MTEVDYTILDLLSNKRFECNRINFGLVRTVRKRVRHRNYTQDTKSTWSRSSVRV